MKFHEDPKLSDDEFHYCSNDIPIKQVQGQKSPGLVEIRSGKD